MTRNPHIIIIGAGVAGIAAARRLFDHGYTKLTILEAEKRIGGRIHSIKGSNSLLELGAQWCHGEKDNTVYNLVKNLDVLAPSFNNYEDLNFYDSSGQKIDKGVTDILCGIFEEITDDEESLSEEKGSFGDYFLRRYNDQIKELFPNDQEKINVALDLIDSFQNLTLCYDAAPSWFDISPSGLLVYKECEGNLLLDWKKYGYSTILDILMKRYPDKSEALPILQNVHFSKEVQKISWESDQVIVRCSDESEFGCDHVIFTASLGVLKENHKKLFVPELPLYKQNAISGLGIGTVNKIFVKFPYKWWPDDCTGFTFVWNAEDRLELIKNFPYGPIKNGRSWLEDIFGFYVIDGDSTTLMGWNVGVLANEVELLPEEVIAEGCRHLLDRFLGKTFKIPAFERITRTQWHSNPHFRGSYSYRSVDSDRMAVTAEDLARPLSSKSGKSTLLFAGEATHSCFYSSVHGALESGFREAERLINLYEKPEMKSCHIAIIGSGMAGLGAATSLLQAGIEDFLILEATDKPGGRINTITLDGNALELGAQWLHGSSNYLYKLAVENDLILEETSEEGLGLYVRNDGFIFDDFLVRKIDFIIGKILEDCEKFVNSPNYPNSIGEFLQEKFEKYLENCEETAEFKEMASELYDWHTRFQIIDNSCLDLTGVSAKDWGKYSFVGTDRQKHMNLKNGYKSLVDILLKSIPKQSLLLESPVLKIDYSKSKIHLICRGKLNVFADHVIATPSVGVLKQNLIQFHPRLPDGVRRSIEDLGMYGMGKIFLVFETKWWKTEGYQLIWKKNAVLDDDTSWIRYLTGFDTVINQPKILVGWIGGKGIEKMESLREEILGQHCVDLLRMFLKDPDIPLPVKVIKSCWTSDPWARGAYSYTTPACDRSGCGPSSLAVPVEVAGVPKVLFAGEAVHESHFSTTHGAFESGQQQIEKLLKFFNRHRL